MCRLLLAGESWTTTSIHTKGFDSFTTVEYAEGATALIGALRERGHEVTYLPNHVAASAFPSTPEALDQYDAILLSDIGANTLLLGPATFVRGQVSPDPLRNLVQWVRSGGGLGMVGGYLSFQGIEGKANYRNTVLADILPVVMEPGDDREERPAGVNPERVGTSESFLDGVAATWPTLLGFQRLKAKPEATVLAMADQWPLLVLGNAGDGRTLAYASDIGPHWAPESFTSWSGFPELWDRCVRWLAGELSTRSPETASAIGGVG